MQKAQNYIPESTSSSLPEKLSRDIGSVNTYGNPRSGY